MNFQQWARLSLALCASVVLSGCAVTRMVESYVSSFTGSSGAVTNVGYRFERLPSQMADLPQQERLETLAMQPLARVGLTRNDASPLYTVQITLRVQQTIRSQVRVLRQSGFYVGADGLLREPPSLQLMEPPWYIHSVQIMLRNTVSGQVDYESTAVHEGPWSDTSNLLPVMLDAALRDYPNPPSGPRRVVIDLVPEVPANSQ